MVIDLIIPALNEEGTIPRLLSEVDRSIIREIIVVDNGSIDLTAQVAAGAGALVLQENRRGYGYACMKGIHYCIGKPHPPELLVFMDGDGADDPADLYQLLKPFINGKADLVIGSRVARKSDFKTLTTPQRFGNWLSTRLIQLFFGVSFTDLGPFRVIRLSELQKLAMKEMTYGWTVEMQVKAAGLGLRCVEVEVNHRMRFAGQSKVSGTIRGSLLAGYRILLVIFRYALIRRSFSS